MAKKKQGFIYNILIKPISPLRRAFAFLPHIIPFLGKQKVELDKWSEIARERLKNPAKSNLILGKEFFDKNSISDAITRFKIAIYMKKDYSEAYFCLGKAYLIKSKINKAKLAFQKAKDFGLKNDELRYMHEVYNQQKIGAKPSPELMKLYFNKFAEIFDNYYIDNFEYTGHEKIASIFSTHNELNKASILDLGCGSGNLGIKLKEQNNNFSLTGLDFSETMLDRAKKAICDTEGAEEVIDLTKGENKAEETKNTVYDYLVKADLLKYNNNQNTKYDAVVARGIFNYTKNLKEAFANIKPVLRKDGLFIFYSLHVLSKERLSELEEEFSFPFFCNHYSHNETEIKKACKDNSFSLVTSQDFTLEKKTKATVFVFKKD